MISRRPFRALLLLVLVPSLAFTVSPAAANLIGNGRLEMTPDPSGVMQLLSPGSTALAPWAISRGNVEEVGSAYWAAADGGCSLALNGTTAGGVSQSFATVPGGQYGVDFSLSGDPFSTPVLKHLRVAAAGASNDYTFDVTPVWDWNMDWQRIHWTFTAVSTSTTLEFYSLEVGAATGPAIDSVVVSLISLVGVEGGGPALSLAPAAPNPASGASRIAWSLPAEARARIAVYDVRGREVAVLADGVYGPGAHSARWDAADAAPGVYLLALESGGQRLTRRLAVVH
jgi:choice-of-anchor C domain-containing protein